MALAINFRWKTPAISAPQSQAQKDNLNNNLIQMGNSIAAMKQSWRDEEDRERRYAIEDEDRARRMGREDRVDAANMESARLIRGKLAELNRLRAERADVLRQINELRGSSY